MGSPRTFKYFTSADGNSDPSSEDFGIIVNNINRPILPAIRTRETTVPGKDGTWDFGGETFDNVKLSIDCTILNPLDNLTNIRDIAKWLSTKKGKILISDEPDRYYYGKISDGISDQIDNAVNTGKFTVEFICDPFAYALLETTANFIVDVDSMNVMVPNIGTRDIKPKIIVTGNFDSIDFTIPGTDQWLYFSLGVPLVDQELIIDCANYTAKMPKLASPDRLDKLGGNVDEMLTFVEDNNTVAITGVNLDCTVKFVFRPMFF